MKKVLIALGLLFVIGCSTQEKPMSTYESQKEYLEQKEKEVEEKIKQLESYEKDCCEVKISEILKIMAESAESVEVKDRITLEPIETE